MEDEKKVSAAAITRREMLTQAAFGVVMAGCIAYACSPRQSAS